MAFLPMIKTVNQISGKKIAKSIAPIKKPINLETLSLILHPHHLFNPYVKRSRIPFLKN